ncbi:MAG: hypothetical protein OES99_01655 [Gammaproteobacteria bacterium]|nr:hypothetical protein [Gammaproteobacteria bacterium]
MRATPWLFLFLSLSFLAGCPTGGFDEDILPPPRVVNATVTPDSFLRFDNTFMVAGQSQIESEAYATAYIAAVDPNDRRTTLAAFKAVNGFDNGVGARVTFRDSKDLGYGRDMFARRRADGGIAIFVDSYRVVPVPGDATQYGPINLDAAVAQDRQFHFSTSAIEFSPIDESDPDSDKIVKMFLYGPPDENGTQLRLTSNNMDGRGERGVPTACLVCHGGTMYPLNADGSFPLISLKSAKMNVLDPITFEFPPMTEAEQEGPIKLVNRMVHDHYVEMGTRADTEQSKWDSAFAAELAAGPYGDDFSANAYDESFVPEGWRQDPNRPDSVEVLYKEVIEPHCIACHSLRGNNSGEEFGNTALINGHEVPLGNATSFSSYEKFISYNDDTIDRVYRRGNMPVSLLNYSRFWRNPAGPPSLLATFLDGFDVFDSNGNVAPPGRPVPLPGANRTVTSPAIQDASASVLTESFAWSIVSMPANGSASLSNGNSSAATLTGDDGDYVLELAATNAMASTTAQVTLTIDSTLAPPPAQLDFATDIREVLATASGANRSCVSCHRTGSSEFAGLPLFLDDTNPNLYKDVVERINFADPENSLLLRKSSALQHGGGIVLDRSVPVENAQFIILLNWIRNGAPCGSDPTFCN